MTIIAAVMVMASIQSVVSFEESVCELSRVDRRATTAQRCLSCHDGSCGRVIASGRGNHPFDVSVYAARPGASIRRSIPSRIVLVNGSLVSCTTCHNYWAVPRQPKCVSVPKGELCESCHDK